MGKPDSSAFAILKQFLDRITVAKGDIGRYLYDLEEGFARIHEHGTHFTRGKDRRTGKDYMFKWDPPQLPAWALPTKPEPSGTLKEAPAVLRTTPRVVPGGMTPQPVVPATLPRNPVQSEVPKTPYVQDLEREMDEAERAERAGVPPVIQNLFKK